MVGEGVWRSSLKQFSGEGSAANSQTPGHMEEEVGGMPCAHLSSREEPRTEG